MSQSILNLIAYAGTAACGIALVAAVAWLLTIVVCGVTEWAFKRQDEAPKPTQTPSHDASSFDSAHWHRSHRLNARKAAAAKARAHPPQVRRDS